MIFLQPETHVKKPQGKHVAQILAAQGFGRHSLVGFRLPVGVIRRSNAKHLRRSRFIDSAQFKTANIRKPGAVAAQRLLVISATLQNSSQTVVKPPQNPVASGKMIYVSLLADM